MAVTVTAYAKEATASVTRHLRAATPKRGLRGAMFGLPYRGPIITKATAAGTQTGTGVTVTHIDGVAGGGTEDSKAYRKSDTYDASGETGGLTGGPATSVTRPNPGAVPAALRATQAYIGAGIQGGSAISDTAPGKVIDPAGRANDTGVDRFGRTRGTPNSGAGAGWYTYTNFDGRATVDEQGGQAAGIGSRGTSISDETVTVNKPGPAPTYGAVATGVVALADLTAGAGFSVNVAAADLTAPRAGIEMAVFRQGNDTDEDRLTLVGYFIVTGTTGATTVPGTTTVTTYVVYTRFLGPGIAPTTAPMGQIADPRVLASSGWSARTTITTT